MDLFRSCSLATPFCILALLLSNCKGLEGGATFTFVNKCGYTVWPGILPGAGTPPLATTGFQLPKKDSRTFQAPPGWSGRFWARTGCTFDSSGHGSCATGDCGSGQMECNGAGAAPPATLAEFTLGQGGADDFYDVSLVDGYNVAMMVEGSTGSGASCTTTGCIADLNARCPSELRVGDGEACKSACEAFGTAEYCCSGEYGSPATCKPTVYSAMFKAACPKSYTYAYDDASSTFTCSSAAHYTITFCPNFSSVKSKTEDSLPKAVSTVLGGKGSWLANLALGDSTRPQPSCAVHVLTLVAAAAVSSISFII